MHVSLFWYPGDRLIYWQSLISCCGSDSLFSVTDLIVGILFSWICDVWIVVSRSFCLHSDDGNDHIFQWAYFVDGRTHTCVVDCGWSRGSCLLFVNSVHCCCICQFIRIYGAAKCICHAMRVAADVYHASL